jgi:hypothetical protein
MLAALDFRATFEPDRNEPWQATDRRPDVARESHSGRTPSN